MTMKIAALAALVLALVASPCAAHECKVVCDAAHPSPVCGSDNKTYASACFLEFAKCDKPQLTLVHDHACPDTKSTTTTHISVNTKKEKKKKETRERTEDDDDDDDEDDVSEDDDEEEDKCDKGCTRELDQLCASDGKTYDNTCLFEIAMCRNPKLKVVDAEGPCPKKTDRDGDDDDDDDDDDDNETEGKTKADKCAKGCTRELDQLCASDGKTYNNPCLFEIAKCRTPKLTVVNADGPCPDKCQKDCTRELEQLCASNGKTYDNVCLFENAKCTNKSLTIVDEDGPCP